MKLRSRVRTRSGLLALAQHEAGQAGAEDAHRGPFARFGNRAAATLAERFAAVVRGMLLMETTLPSSPWTESRGTPIVSPRAARPAKTSSRSPPSGWES